MCGDLRRAVAELVLGQLHLRAVREMPEVARGAGCGGAALAMCHGVLTVGARGPVLKLCCCFFLRCEALG